MNVGDREPPDLRVNGQAVTRFREHHVADENVRLEGIAENFLHPVDKLRLRHGDDELRRGLVRFLDQRDRVAFVFDDDLHVSSQGL